MQLYVAIFFRGRSTLLMFECFHCLSRSVVWGADFSFEDYGLEGEGIIHECHCSNCGADITYYIRTDNPDDEAAET